MIRQILLSQSHSQMVSLPQIYSQGRALPYSKHSGFWSRVTLAAGNVPTSKYIIWPTFNLECVWYADKSRIICAASITKFSVLETLETKHQAYRMLHQYRGAPSSNKDALKIENVDRHATALKQDDANWQCHCFQQGRLADTTSVVLVVQDDVLLWFAGARPLCCVSINHQER